MHFDYHLVEVVYELYLANLDVLIAYFAHCHHHEQVGIEQVQAQFVEKVYQ